MKIIVKQPPRGVVTAAAKVPVQVQINESPAVVTPIPPTQEQVQEAVDIYLAANPVSATPEQVAIAVTAYLTAHPVDPVPPTEEQVLLAVIAYLEAHPVQPIAPTQAQVSAGVTAYLIANPVEAIPPTPEQVQEAVDIYLDANPVQPIAPTQEQVSLGVDAFLTAHPVEPIAPTGMQVAAAVAALLTQDPELFYEPIDAYFADNPALRQAMKGAAFGVAELDGSGSLAQRMKIAGGSTPGIIRDTVDEGNGKSSLYAASIASLGKTTIIVRTGVWRGELDYAFRVFGTTSAGVVNLSIYRTWVDGATFYGYMNNGNVPVAITFGMTNDGYSGWAIEGDFGRCQMVVTDVAVVGNGTGDPEVRAWSMTSAMNSGSLSQHVTVPRQSIPA